MNPPTPGSALVLYAFSLGLVAALNPCGLPMLPAFLALFAGAPAGPVGPRIARGLLGGAGMSAGFVAVFGSLGLVLVGGAQLAAGWLPWVMIAVALGMTVAGVFTVAGRGPRLRLPAPRVRPGRSVLAMVAYGAAYAVGSLSCSLPLFLAAVGGSFTGRGVLAGLSSYLAYALGMGLFVCAAAVVTTTAGAAALAHIRAAARWLPVVSGTILAASGAYLAYYWVNDLRDPAATSPVTSAVDRAQTGLASLVGASPLLAAIVLGVIVLASITVVIAHTLAEPHEHTDPATRSPSRKGGNAP